MTLIGTTLPINPVTRSVVVLIVRLLNFKQMCYWYEKQQVFNM